VRDALLAEAKLTHQLAEQAADTEKVRIYLAVEQGVTTYELAQELGMSQSVVSNWRRQGEEAYKRRESARSQPPGQDLDRSAEREPLG
jgi:transposase-like protein